MIHLHQGEKILKIVRRHWYVVVIGCASFALMAFFPILIMIFLGLVSEAAVEFVQMNLALLVFVDSAWLLVMWVMCCAVWTNYYLDILVITNKRIIDIEQIGLFSRNVAEMRLDSLEDMRVEVAGILPTVLQFGDLHLQTAGSEKEFIVHDIPRPLQIKNLIADQYNKYVEKDIVMGGHKRKLAKQTAL